MPKEESAVPSVILYYNGSPQTFVWKYYGFELCLHQSNIHSTLPVSLSAHTSGNFIFPGKYNLVSSVYQISCDEKIPATIKIYHCTKSTHHLKFAISSDKIPPYNFEIVDSGQFLSNFGKIRVQKFSLFTVVWNYYFPCEEMYSVFLCHSFRPTFYSPYRM